MVTVLMCDSAIRNQRAFPTRARLRILTGKWFCLGIALVIIVLSEATKALAIQSPSSADMAPTTLELRSNQIKFNIIAPDDTPPAGFEQPGFDDTGFLTGNGPFGSGGGCPLQSSVATDWPINTQLIVRQFVSIPAGAGNVHISLSVDNDVLGVFFNGIQIAGPIQHDECPGQDEFRFDVADSLVHPGDNIVAFRVLDRGFESFFDARILVNISPDQVLETGGVQTPIVPVRDAVVACGLNDDPTRRSSIIPYAVGATGEFGEIRIEQTSEETLSAETFLGGEQIAMAIATPDENTISRSPTATKRESALDFGILSASSVFTDQSVLKGLFRCGVAAINSSCEEACNRKAIYSSIVAAIVRGLFGNPGVNTPAFVTLTAFDEAYSATRIETIRKQCIAACPTTPPPCMPGDPPPCPQPPPPPSPGTLNAYFIFDAAGTQPFDQPVEFSGTLTAPLNANDGGKRSFDVSKTERVTPGPHVGVGLSQGSLAAGTWTVTANPMGITFPQTCPNVKVPNGGAGFVQIDVSGGHGLMCKVF
jgi:hypothetical protein